MVARSLPWMPILGDVVQPDVEAGEAAQTWAMPLPIWPAPMTPTVLMSVVIVAWLSLMQDDTTGKTAIFGFAPYLAEFSSGRAPAGALKRSPTSP